MISSGWWSKVITAGKSSISRRGSTPKVPQQVGMAAVQAVEDTDDERTAGHAIDSSASMPWTTAIEPPGAPSDEDIVSAAASSAGANAGASLRADAHDVSRPASTRRSGSPSGAPRSPPAGADVAALQRVGDLVRRQGDRGGGRRARCRKAGARARTPSGPFAGCRVADLVQRPCGVDVERATRRPHERAEVGAAAEARAEVAGERPHVRARGTGARRRWRSADPDRDRPTRPGRAPS